MESLWEITGKTPETHHETWFLETYGPLIQDALGKLRNPPDPSHPALTWQLFKQVRLISGPIVGVCRWCANVWIDLNIVYFVHCVNKSQQNYYLCHKYTVTYYL